MKYTLFALFLMLSATAHASTSTGVAKKFSRAVYDVDINGGQSTSHDLHTSLPAGAVITDFWVYINEAFTDSGTGSLAIQCYGSQDLLGYVDITAASLNQVYTGRKAADNFANTYLIGGTASAAAVNGSSVPSACTVTAVVRGDAGYVPLTAGKLTALIEYFDSGANED